MSIKGYADQKKIDAGAPQFGTIAPVREQQHGLDVIAHAFAQTIAADAVEAGSTTRIINATAHVALVGDIISFTSGNLNTKEYRVLSVAANAITVVEEMSEAPAAADTFNILRQKVGKVDSTGAVSVILGNDTNYGVVGANTLRTASQIGNATGAASFGAGVVGAQVLRNTPASDSPHLLATRHEAAATPLATRSSNGAAFDAYGSDATGTTTPRVVTASRAKAHLATLDYSGTNVTTAAYVEVIAVTAAAINRLYLADTSGSAMILAVGAAAAEVDQLYLGPGHSGWIDLNIPASARVSLKAIDATANSGRFIFTGLS